MRASADGRSPRHDRVAYLRAVETLLKVFFRLVPRPWTTAMIATEMPAAMRPYSMAVAAVSSLRKEDMRFVIANSFWSRTGTYDFSYSYRSLQYQLSTIGTAVILYQFIYT